MELKEGYRMTEVGVIPVDWEVMELEQLTSLMTNGFVGIATTFYSSDSSDILYIQGYNVEANGYNFNGIKYVTKEFHKKHQKSCLKEGDLLTIQTGDVGLTTIVPKELEGSNCHALIISRFKLKHFDPKYFCHYLNSNYGRSRLKQIEIGTTMKHINVGDMLRFKVPVPPLKAEQAAIATALSDMDALIAQTEKLIEKKKAIKQGVMQRLLSPYDQDGNLKEGWVKKRLGEIISVSRGGSPRPIQNYITSSANGINWIKIGDTSVTSKYISMSNERIIPEGVIRSREVFAGDFLLSNSMSFGRPYILKIGGCIHDGWLVLQNYQQHVDRDYLYYFLVSPYVLNQYKNLAAGSSVLNLNKEIVKKVLLKMPISQTKQREIAGTLCAIDDEIDILEQRLRKLQHQKQGMMQSLLTGRIRIYSPQHESTPTL